MYSSITYLLAALLASATSVLAQQDVASPPFALVLQSMNTTLNNTVLTPCHEGAAIEGLCATNLTLAQINANSTLNLETFNFNTSTTTSSTPKPQSGLLTWLLRGGNFELSSPLSLSYNPFSNVAIPLFTPGDGDQFVFTETNYLGIQSYIDDTVVPIKTSGNSSVVRRWHLCDTYYGYRYTTLAWVMGNGKPQNPTCQKVEVKRVFT